MMKKTCNVYIPSSVMILRTDPKEVRMRKIIRTRVFITVITPTKMEKPNTGERVIVI